MDERGASRMTARLRTSMSERKFLDEGATATEYAIMVSLVTLVILLSVAAFGQAVLVLFQDSGESLARALGF